MGHHQTVVGLRQIQEAGSTPVVRGTVVEVFVHLVGQDPGAGATAMGQQGALLVMRQGPTRGKGNNGDCRNGEPDAGDR